jgi:hypothetical protein
MPEQLPPRFILRPKSNPVPSDLYNSEPTERFTTNSPIELAIAKYYYEREWKVSRIVTRSIDGNDYPYFAFISRFDEDKGDMLTIPIGWVPGDLPNGEELRRERMEYGEERMAGPLSGKGELWITHSKGEGSWTAERWVLYPPASKPRWRKAETIEFSTE